MRPGGTRRATIGVHAAAAALAATLGAATYAQSPLPSTGPRLPLQRFDVADGLAHSITRTLLFDASGYLWAGTDEGLSRFDGHEFRPFLQEIPTPYINALALAPDGTVWVGTNGSGLARITPDGRFRELTPPPSVYSVGSQPLSEYVNALVVDSAGRVWCGTDDGLFREAPGAGTELRFESWLPPGPTRKEIPRLISLRNGLLLAAVVAGTSVELLVIDPDLAPGSGTTIDRHTGPAVLAAAADGAGAIVAVNDRLVRYQPDADGWRSTPLAARLPAVGDRTALLVDGRDRLWAGTPRGLFRLDGGRWTHIGLPETVRAVLSLAQQADGTLWIGTRHGLARLLPYAIASWTPAEGLDDADMWEVFEDRGRVQIRGRSLVMDVSDDRVRRLASLPERSGSGILGMRRGTDGTTWLVSAAEIHEIPATTSLATSSTGWSHRPPPGGYGWSLTAVQASTPFIDRQGLIWFASHDGLYFRRPGAMPGSSLERRPLELGDARPKIVHEDRRGRLWLASNTRLGVVDGDRARYFDATSGLPETQPRAVYADERGRLWIGLRYRGLSVTADPEADTPRFRNYSTADGLSSNTVWAICGDRSGRLYLGTGRGLDRLDPDTGRIRRLTTTDGLIDDVIRSCAIDEAGYVWVGTAAGVSRIDPQSIDPPGTPPSVRFTRVEVAGEDLLQPGQGVSLIDDVTLDTSRHSLRIDFVAPNLRGDHLLYQYRLTDDSEWSPPGPARTVNYPRLPPGGYRFEVRAVSPQGALSEVPAVMTFRIEQPLWRRPWFMVLAIALALGASYGVARVRSRRALALEQVRRRIAVDLHDDLGASLVQVAVLSEVARRTAPSSDEEHRLATIGDLARDMRSSLSDIVWSIDPRRDNLADLVVRVREIATNLLDARATVTCDPGRMDASRVALPPDHRRQLLLFCKEALANAARHASPRAVQVTFAVDGQWLSVDVADDGRGLPATVAAGQGLASLEDRIGRLGGEFTVDSVPGAGVRLHARVPIG